MENKEIIQEEKIQIKAVSYNPIFIDQDTFIRKEEKEREEKTIEEERKELKDGLNKATGKIIGEFRKKSMGFSLDQMANIFFKNLVDNTSDEEIKSEISFLRNKMSIILDTIKQV